MRRILFSICLLILAFGMCPQNAYAQASASITASPSSGFYYQTPIYIDASVTDSPLDWCYNYGIGWECYWNSSAQISAGGGGWGDSNTGLWSVTLPTGEDDFAGGGMVPTTYYASGGVYYWVQICYDYGDGYYCDDPYDWWENADTVSTTVYPAWTGCGETGYTDGWSGPTHMLSEYYEGGWGSPYTPGWCGVNDTPLASNYAFTHTGTDRQWASKYDDYDWVDWDWALLGYDLVWNVDCLEVYYWGSPAGMDSGYRTPARQAALNPGYMQSLHTMGEAADLAYVNNTTDWNWMKTQAKSGSICDEACVEPWTPGSPHLHVEYSGGNLSCLAGW